MHDFSALAVQLNEYPVGTLTRLPGDRIVFQFHDAYLADHQRPTLSYSFYDALHALIPSTKTTQTRAPAFFSNLLPEGHLREYLAKQANIKPIKEFDLLALLGDDLPGAIRLVPMEMPPYLVDSKESLRKIDEPEANILKFSLAGVQLKFSVLLEPSGGLTIPAHGEGGDWVVKLPSMRFQNVPENEFSMLMLAKAINIEIPEISLIDMKEISSLPKFASTMQGKALITKRYDRTEGTRIHSEDLAQVYGVYPHKKYDGVSYSNITNMLLKNLSETVANEFVKRLVFNILIGNGDMHLKNWSFIYPDTRSAVLAPAYDYVATHLYMENESLALSFGKEKKFANLNRETVKHFAKKSEMSEKQVLAITDETIDATVSAWKILKDGFPLTKSVLDAQEKQMMTMAKQLSE
ncbi:MAG: putative kinase Y4dM [marine bacterium B5-7]|nr:MAG: putative kinase Y4dM [marine bacterium B5-7]